MSTTPDDQSPKTQKNLSNKNNAISIAQLTQTVNRALLLKPKTLADLQYTLSEAQKEGLFDADTLSMLEGAIQVNSQNAGDIMVPRSQITFVNVTSPLQTIIDTVNTYAHSRYPVYEGQKDNVLGILLAKDLLRFVGKADQFDLRGILRPISFIPQSKQLNVLLRDFRVNRNHIALVVDEYGSVSGLLTIEDVLEQIVGDIEDEHDFDEQCDNIVATSDDAWRVRGLTEVSHFNEYFNASLPEDDSDTVGGLVARMHGRVPKRGSMIHIDGFSFEVVRGDARKIDLLLVRRLPDLEIQNQLTQPTDS